MNSKRIYCLLILCLLVVFMLGLFTQDAAAQPSDTDYMQKKGIGGLFQGKNKKDPRAPTRAQKYLGLGSLAVMIIVVKYL